MLSIIWDRFEDPICLSKTVIMWESRHSEVWTMLHRHVLNICRHTFTHMHTEWFTFWVLHPGSEIRPSCPMIWVWRSSMRQSGDCWSVRIAGFTDAWERQRERLITLVVSECFCGMGEWVIHLRALWHVSHNLHILTQIPFKVSQLLLWLWFFLSVKRSVNKLTKVHKVTFNCMSMTYIDFHFSFIPHRWLLSSGCNPPQLYIQIHFIYKYSANKEMALFHETVF